MFVAHGTAQALEDWIRVRGERPGKLFLPINKGGSVPGVRMSDQSVYKLLAKRRSQAGLPPLSPHDLRRTSVIMWTFRRNRIGGRIVPARRCR